LETKHYVPSVDSRRMWRVTGDEEAEETEKRGSEAVETLLLLLHSFRLQVGNPSLLRARFGTMISFSQTELKAGAREAVELLLRIGPCQRPALGAGLRAARTPR
jgi:hypothetical protein